MWTLVRKIRDRFARGDGILNSADYNTKFHSILGANKVRLRYWPNYRNPYQRLFYGSGSKNFVATPGSAELALKSIGSEVDYDSFFHLHWLNFLFDRSDDRATAANIEGLLVSLERFCDLGGKVLWTVHNLREHDGAGGHHEYRLRKNLSDLASLIFVHSEYAKSQVVVDLGISEDKCVVIPHGSYIGVYPDSVDFEMARRYLGLNFEAKVFLSLGYVRGYKGLLDLGKEVEEIPNSILLVAGHIAKKQAAQSKRDFAFFKDTILYEGWVKDSDIQLFMNAADFVVLPYHSALTSGSAFLAQSFAVPVIAPDISAFRDIIDDGRTGFLYDQGASGALGKVLRHASGISSSELAAMRAQSFKSVSRFLWSDARLIFFGKLRDLIE